MKKAFMKKGFTIVELIIAITVILILAGAAVTGSAGLIRSIRFTNAFNKIVFMVQQARSLAVTGKNSATVQSYGVRFELVTPFSATLYNIQSGVSQDSDILQLEPTTNLALYSSPNCTTARIQFTNGSGETNLNCEGGTETSPSFLVLGICEGTENTSCTDNPDNAPRHKNFSIHRVAGIPQIE